MVLTGWYGMLKKVIFIPQRYFLGIMGLFAMANCLNMRVALSMTITQMVSHVAPSKEVFGETCPDSSYADPISNTTSISINNVRELYDWNEATQGLLLGAFYYGFTITHLPGGLLADKFGGKWTLGIGLFVTSVATILTPWALNFGDAFGLFIIRAILGSGEGVVTPAFIVTLSHWIPSSERSRFGAMVFGGAQIGNILGSYLSGVIMTDGGDWRNVYYIFGSLGLIWCIFWGILCFSTPDTHPFISEKEKDFLKETVVASPLHKGWDSIPIRAMMTSVPLWALVVAYVGHAWGLLTIITVLPKYLSGVLKFNIKQTGLMSALPYIAMYLFSIVSAGLCDLCIEKKWHSILNGRKLYTTLSSTVAGMFMVLASFSGCDRFEAVGFFVAAMALMGSFYCSIKVNSMDIAPNYAGTCSALGNGLASIVGIVSPYLIGLMTPDQTVEQWRLAFWVMFAILISTNIVFLIWGSGEQQWWDDVDKYGYPPGWKHGTLSKSCDPEKKVCHYAD